MLKNLKTYAIRQNMQLSDMHIAGANCILLLNSLPVCCLSTFYRLWCNVIVKWKIDYAAVLFFNTIFVSSHMYPENPEGTRVIVGSMNMGYYIYPTLPGIELTTCSIPIATCHCFTVFCNCIHNWLSSSSSSNFFHLHLFLQLFKYHWVTSLISPFLGSVPAPFF